MDHMKPPAPYLPAASPALSQADQEALTDLYVRGTPANTLRAYERDLLYVTAWKSARFSTALDWPESEATALAFILDHARDLGDAPKGDIARQAAEGLIAQGLRRSLACPRRVNTSIKHCTHNTICGGWPVADPRDTRFVFPPAPCERYH